MGGSPSSSEKNSWWSQFLFVSSTGNFVLHLTIVIVSKLTT